MEASSTLGPNPTGNISRAPPAAGYQRHQDILSTRATSMPELPTTHHSCVATQHTLKLAETVHYP